MEIILERCLPKADMENITIKCGINESIAIREAFFTTTMIDQCHFIANINGNSNETYQQQPSCTDDLRLTMNAKCSGHQACIVNLRKMHNNQCTGYDGWINLKYTCVPKIKINSYCNIKLMDQYGYVTNPGYPKFYPPYDCKWIIQGFIGQRIQIDILDLSLKEPRYISNKKLLNNYQCIDNLSIIDINIKRLLICGETKTNLLSYRSKSNELLINFQSFEFSPTRGIMFRYNLIDCPTLKPPINGYMYRNHSYAYYNCYFDYIFEDTKQSSKVLYCHYETYWNDTVTRCVAKENVTENNVDNDEKQLIIENAYALGSRQDTTSISAGGKQHKNRPSIIDTIDNFLTNPLTFIIIGIISLCIVFIIIAIIIHSNYRYGSIDIPTI